MGVASPCSNLARQPQSESRLLIATINLGTITGLPFWVGPAMYRTVGFRSCTMLARQRNLDTYSRTYTLELGPPHLLRHAIIIDGP